MAPYVTNVQMEALKLARVLNSAENQAKLAAGEIIFEGFDPTTDPAYLAIHTRGALTDKDLATEHQQNLFDSENHIDSNPYTGVNYGPQSYADADAETKNGDITAEKQVSLSSQKIPQITDENIPISGILPSSIPAASITPKTPVLSYSSINNSKKKKDGGKDFMRTKVKHFDDWLQRMKRAPLPPRPKGADGSYTISTYKQKSAAIKALTIADDKRLVAFITSKEKALKAVEQAGYTNPAMYDEDGMLVVDDENTAKTKKRSYRELLDEEEQEAEIGGMTAAALTAPLDVLKTRLQSDFYQAQLAQSRLSKGISPHAHLSPFRSGLLHFRETFQVLGSVHRVEGWRALFKGLRPNLVGVVPAITPS